MITPTHGLVPICLAPFHDDGSVDLEAGRELLEFYIRAGSAGLFVNCASGEMFQLTPQEHVAIARNAVHVARGRVQVLATLLLAADHVADLELARRLHDAGVSTVVLLTGQLAAREESDEVLASRFWRLAESLPAVEFGLYECPSPYKRLVTERLLGDGARRGRLCYLKDTSLSTDRVAARVAAVRGTGCGIFDAHTPHALASLRLGANGVSTIAANFFPEAFAWLCNHVDSPEANWLQEELIAADKLIGSGGYPKTAKRFCQLRGLRITTCSRSSTEPLSADSERTCEELWRRLHTWRDRLGLTLA